MLGGALLLVCFVAVFVMARAWLYQIGERSVPLAGVVMAGAMSTVPTSLCRVVGDLVWSTILFGVVSAAIAAYLWRRGPAVSVPPRVLRVTPWWIHVLVLATIVLAAWAALAGHWWDEHNCHNGVVTVLARGIVPPVHPLFPTEPFRYHYGFDVLAAQVRAFTGASADDAIDAATILCFVLLIGMARDVGEKLAGRRAAYLAMFLVPFGGGLLSLFFWVGAGPLELRWDLIPTRWLALEVPPSVITNFYQHPQGLGMPVSLGVLYLMTDKDQRPGRMILGALLLGALSLAQIVFFGLIGLMLGVVVVFRFIRDRSVRRALFSIALLLGALAMAYGLGGMLERGPEVERVMRYGAQFFSASLPEVLLLHVVHFGVPLFGVIVALVFVRRRATPLMIALLTGALIGFVVPNVMVYARSWDIVKFYGVGAFFANVILAALLADLLKRKSWFARALAVTLVAATVFTGYLWIVRMGVLDGRAGVPPMHFPGPSPIGEATARRLEPLLDNDEFVFSTNVDIGLAGGMLTPGFDWRVSGQGYMLDRKVSDKLLMHRRIARRHLRRADLDALGVNYIVLAPAEITALSAEGKATLEDKTKFEHLFDVEKDGHHKRVYRILR